MKFYTPMDHLSNPEPIQPQERRIYARLTDVLELPPEESQVFMENEHRQGSVRLPKTKSYSFGLIYQGELIAAIQFCKPRTAKMERRYSFELLRLAFKKGIRIPGGASKLIGHFREHYNPPDFFTYQDRSGESTDVYSHAGMELVRESGRRPKEYLVAPGKTLGTASRREALGMAYATRYGPDRILGTKLGEIFDGNGKRKSNRRIFIENLGWHIEETAGDRIYEWVDKDRTYYTYRITASDSDKYYIGVSHLKIGDATAGECLNDGYMGSGGVKFQNWFRIHGNSCSKEILGLYKRKSEAFTAEKELIGDLYSRDDLCLNSAPGGKDNRRIEFVSVELRECPEHGLCAHHGEVCYSCMSNGRYRSKECDIHGETTHNGNSCVKCYIGGSFSLANCPSHGETLFHGESCKLCSAEGSIGLRRCSTHGKTKHIGGKCYKCIADNSIIFSKRLCPIHGESTFRGERCTRCLTAATFTLGVCVVHGEVQH